MQEPEPTCILSKQFVHRAVSVLQVLLEDHPIFTTLTKGTQCGTRAVFQLTRYRSYCSSSARSDHTAIGDSSAFNAGLRKS